MDTMLAEDLGRKIITISKSSVQKTKVVKNVRLKAVRLSYEDVHELVTRMENFIHSVNTLGDFNEPELINVSFEKNSSEFDLDKESLICPNTEMIPNQVLKMTLHFRQYNQPISNAFLYCADDYRSISVGGKDPRAVDMLISIVTGFLSDKSTHFGGHYFRVMVTIIISGVGSIVLPFIFLGRFPQFIIWWPAYMGLYIAYSIATQFGLPNLFPGTRVYRKPSSWFRKNFNAIVGVLSLVITIVTLLAQYLL